MSVLEPPDLSRTDGKRPGGLTLVPWKRGKSMVWDFSCCCTIANSLLTKSARAAGSAAESRAKAKEKKYEALSDRYYFVLLVMESHGPLCKEATDFFRQLGREIEAKTGESRATEYLLQSMSVAVQKGNALSILGTRGEEQENLNEGFAEL